MIWNSLTLEQILGFLKGSSPQMKSHKKGEKVQQGEGINAKDQIVDNSKFTLFQN